jgi:diguanylate cyclase (GGDEF)-like protein
MVAVLRRLTAWIAPPPPPTDDESSLLVEQALVRQAAHLSEVVTALSVPTSICWTVLLWSVSSRPGLLAWLLIVQVLNAWTWWTARRIAQLDQAGPIDRRLDDGLARGLLLNGVSWGLLMVLALPGDERWHALIGMLAITPLAVNAIFAAAMARFFWPFQIGLTVAAAVGLVAAGSDPARAAAVVLIYALPVAGLLVRVNRTTAIAAVSYAIRNQRSAQELRVANDHLAHEASHDSLTGQANRQYFVQRVNEAVRARDRDAGTGHVGVLFMDLDRFKLINDSLGHAAGDQVLRVVAGRIASQLRDNDLLARLGGDEFTVLVEPVGHIGEVEQIAARVLDVFDDPFTLQGRDYDVRVSIGVACTDLDSGLTTSGDLLRAADVALYEAKAAGRGVARTFDAGLRARIDRQRHDEKQLRQALDQGKVIAWFQPIVEIATGRMVSAEALARWTTADGVRPAGTFIDLVASCGLEAELSLGVADGVRHLRRQLKSREATIGIGLNVPPARLTQVLDELQVRGDLRGLNVEITETGVISDLDGARRRLTEIRKLGAAVWLDDFGQGSSSLSLVTQLPLDGVKIDRAFVAEMLHSRAARTVVIAIAEIGRCLGLDVIAEGVETPEQVAALSALGVTHAQGYFISPAVDVEAFLRLVDDEVHWPGVIGPMLGV